MMRFRRTSAILSLYMFLLVVVGGSMEGFVVCILPGGQVTLERASGACCDNDVTHAVGAYVEPADTEASHADNHHCDSCVDIPLYSSGAIRQTSSNASSKLRAIEIAVAPYMAAKYRLTAKQGFYSMPPPAANTTLAALRTVSLLI